MADSRRTPRCDLCGGDVIVIRNPADGVPTCLRCRDEILLVDWFTRAVLIALEANGPGVVPFSALDAPGLVIANEPERFMPDDEAAS